LLWFAQESCRNDKTLRYNRYTFLDNVNRIQGPSDGTPPADLRSSSHLLDFVYNLSPSATLTGYGYLLDFDNAPDASNQTLGLRLAGSISAGDRVTVPYAVEFASQGDNADNPTNYDADYYLLEAGLSSFSALDVAFEMVLGGRYRALLVARMIPGLEDAPVVDWLDLMEDPRRDKESGLRQWQEWAERNDRELEKAVLISYGLFDEVDLFWGSNEWIWLPIYSEFRRSDVFRKHAFEYGYPQLWRELGFPPMCRPVGDDDFECD